MTKDELLMGLYKALRSLENDDADGSASRSMIALVEHGIDDGEVDAEGIIQEIESLAQDKGVDKEQAFRMVAASIVKAVQDVHDEHHS